MAEPSVVREIVSQEPEQRRVPHSGAMVKMRARGVHVFYGENHALQDVDLDITRDEVTALIGPSGCGKSTLLRCFNRMNDTIPGCRVEGEILLDEQPIYGAGMDVEQLRA